MSHTLRWKPICPKLRRVQERAVANRQEKFTSLAHHITVEALLRAYRTLDGNAAAGIDGVTKEAYSKELEQNLMYLQERLKNGKYRAKPVRRVWIEKPEGGKRPLGIPTLEDKIVQEAVVEILNSIYEVDFHGFSYGFRPGRSAHQALQALQTVLQKGKVNWVLDMDISKFFDTINHKGLMFMIRRRVVDRSILRLIGKWLAAGAAEDGRLIRSKEGTPQGGVISPLLANIFLHYVVDEHVHTWRKTEAKGEVYIVRYADDFVIACEHECDAIALRESLRRRLQEHGLTVNEDKSRLIRFGRSWGKGGKPKPETFDFLGFTHIAGKSRTGLYLVIRKTARKRFNRSLKAIAQWCRKYKHSPIWCQWQMICVKLKGHYNYYGVRGNYEGLRRFYHEVRKRWLNALRRRSQKVNISKLCQLLREKFLLPVPRIMHPENWLPVNPGYLLGRAGCGNAACPDL